MSNPLLSLARHTLPVLFWPALLLGTGACSSNDKNADGGLLAAGNGSGGSSNIGSGPTGSGASGNGNGTANGNGAVNGNGAQQGGIDVGQGVGALAPTDGMCNPKLIGTLRDFGPEHPDFQNFNPGLVRGLVKDRLENGVPVLANSAPGGKQAVTSAQTFSEWYSLSHNANATYPFDLDSGYLKKTVDASGRTVYESSAFFPLDGKPSMQPGFKDQKGVERDFHFTFELNTTFVYNGGEVFAFSGDDDLWAFIDGKLVVDIGGVHGVESDQVALDTLKLTKGQQYSLSVFHAERHTSASNFKLTTSITFTNCGVILR